MSSIDLEFNVYADGSADDEDNLAYLIENAKDLQRISSFSEESEDFDDDVALLNRLFTTFKKSDMLMFPYTPEIGNAVDHGVVELNEDDRYRIDRYKLAIECPANSYPRDAIRFDLATTPELPNLTQLLGRYADVGKYLKSGHTRTDEVVLLGVTKDQISALCDVDVDTQGLKTLFTDSLLRIAQSSHGDDLRDDTISMICVDWITAAGAENSNVFEDLNEILLEPSHYEESLSDYGLEWDVLDHDTLSEIKSDCMDSAFSDLAENISEDLKSSGIEYDNDEYLGDLESLVGYLLNTLLFDYGYWDAVLAEKFKAFEDAFGGLPVREISDLSGIVRESRNEGAYVLEVGISWENTLNFLLDPSRLLLQGRLSVVDSYFYDEG
jgi:hypothetical protein